MPIVPTLSPEQYAIERAICDKAQAFWNANATFSKSGWSSMGPELAAHPDYAACDNAMRGRVEQYEILRDLPEKVLAYIGKPESESNWRAAVPYLVTVWTGERIGIAYETGRWKTPRSYVSSHMHQYRATIGGREYTGRGAGVGMCIVLRETAASKRKRSA